MKNLLFISLCLTLLVSCKSEKPETALDTSNFKEVKEVATIDFSGLEPMLHRNDDKIYVVNFWATWCLPCVKELPYFERANQKYKDDNVEVILVSLDFPKQKETRLIPFINKKKLQSEVIHFDDVNEQVWIAKISEDWGGAIPATLIYSKDKRKFYAQSFTEKELEHEIQSFIK